MTQKSEPTVVLIEEIHKRYQDHPIPNLPNFKIVPWEDQETILNADCYIQDNILGRKRRKMEKYYGFILKSGKPFIVTESAVFRRNMVKPPNPMAYHRYSLFSYYRDEGDYNNENCPADRWLKIQKEQKIEIKDWKTTGDYILLILQRPGDSSLKNLIAKYKSHENFLASTIADIRKFTDRPIKIRLHPLRMDQQMDIINRMDLQGIEISTNMHGNIKAGGGEGGDGLYKDFEGAWAVVGFNSNALTESICEGIPTFSLSSTSMAWECSNTDLKYLEEPELFDRSQWLYNLGYCQWTEEEIVRGDPWHHLKPRVEYYLAEGMKYGPK